MQHLWTPRLQDALISEKASDIQKSQDCHRDPVNALSMKYISSPSRLINQLIQCLMQSFRSLASEGTKATPIYVWPSSDDCEEAKNCSQEKLMDACKSKKPHLQTFYVCSRQ